MDVSLNKTNSNCLNLGNKVNFQGNKQILKQEKDFVEISEKKKMSKGKKIAIFAAAAAGVALLTAAAVYKYKQVKVLKNTPEELKNLFNSLKDKDGKEFVDDAYSGIKKFLKLDGIAPEKVELTNKADGIFNTVTGGFHHVENKISFSKGFMTKLTKKQQFNLLSHELKHCKQFTDIIRTEGLGLEALADATVAQMSKGASRPLTSAETNVLKQDILGKLQKAYEHMKDVPKIAGNSVKGLHAKEYLEALKKYEGLGFLGVGGENYKKNLLEVEAYAFGDKMGNKFGAAESIKSKIQCFLRVLKANSKK